MSEGWNNYHKRFDINRPKRRCFDAWVADMQALSGKRDVSQDDLTDAQIHAAFAADPKYVCLDETISKEAYEKFAQDYARADECKTGCQYAKDVGMREYSCVGKCQYAQRYALAEMADGRAREQRKDEIKE